jgi:hypothetical protein
VGESPSSGEAVALINVVAEVAEEGRHHPDIGNRWRAVRPVVTTHGAGGLSRRDFDLARVAGGLLWSASAVPRGWPSLGKAAPGFLATYLKMQPGGWGAEVEDRRGPRALGKDPPREWTTLPKGTACSRGAIVRDPPRRSGRGTRSPSHAWRRGRRREARSRAF